MRTFKLTDDCTLSGVRRHRDDRRVDGGGYLTPDCPDPLVPAHGVVEVPTPDLDAGEKLVPNPYNRSS